jgi:site-specific recombinase XerD
MESQKPSVSPVRQRMIDDMRMRKFGEKALVDYVRAVRKFAQYLQRSPDTASVEELRNYQLHLVDHGVSPASLNSSISGLKFFFSITLSRPELVRLQPPMARWRRGDVEQPLHAAPCHDVRSNQIQAQAAPHDHRGKVA